MQLRIRKKRLYKILAWICLTPCICICIGIALVVAGAALWYAVLPILMEGVEALGIDIPGYPIYLEEEGVVEVRVAQIVCSSIVWLVFLTWIGLKFADLLED